MKRKITPCVMIYRPIIVIWLILVFCSVLLIWSYLILWRKIVHRSNTCNVGFARITPLENHYFLIIVLDFFESNRRSIAISESEVWYLVKNDIVWKNVCLNVKYNNIFCVLNSYDVRKYYQNYKSASSSPQIFRKLNVCFVDAVPD